MKKSLAFILAVLTAFSMAIPVMAVDYPTDPEYQQLKEEGFNEVPSTEVVKEILKDEAPVLTVKQDAEKKETTIKVDEDLAKAIVEAEKPLTIEIKKDDDTVATALTIEPEQAANLKKTADLSVKEPTEAETKKVEKAIEKITKNSDIDVEIEDVAIVNFASNSNFGTFLKPAVVTITVEPTDALLSAADEGKTIYVYSVDKKTGLTKKAGTAKIVDGKVVFDVTGGGCYICIAK